MCRLDRTSVTIAVRVVETVEFFESVDHLIFMSSMSSTFSGCGAQEKQTKTLLMGLSVFCFKGFSSFSQK